MIAAIHGCLKKSNVVPSTDPKAQDQDAPPELPVSKQVAAVLAGVASDSGVEKNS